MTTKKHSPVSVLDLTVAQTIEIEKALHLPMTKWAQHESLAELLTTILATVEGNDVEVYAGLTMKELADRVELSEDEDPNE